METMPLARTMGDMVILPNSNVLIINGAASGTAGWRIARNPVSSQVIYRPDNLSGSKFEVQNPNAIPRMYHSTTVLLRDGRVLVGGSNPNEIYNFTGVLFPTDLSWEAFSPSYLDSLYANLRPRVISPPSHTKIKYGQRVNVRFTVSTLRLNKDLVKVTMVAPGFNTHSNTMNQRMLVLSGGKVKRVGIFTYQINLIFPNSGKLTPPGYCDFRTLSMGNETISKVDGIGIICLETSTGSKLVLKNVKHAPNVRLHLISVGVLNDEGYVSTNGGEKWKLIKGSLVVARGDKHHGL
ncbi:hypothetical protein CQW23_12463 [Capsicum baccatum]|uniref:Uncharacterized protein n=1 Tax=Capsicum baccatum TaxID=33114 RepID=A0A2G2WSN7_CAPBA|nr:hypothetical protein CQW23_12463 [Capsicum baccatum]